MVVPQQIEGSVHVLILKLHTFADESITIERCRFQIGLLHI